MFSGEFYKTFHILSALVVFASLGAATAVALNGTAQASDRSRKLASISHGVGLLLILVSGFGALARLGADFGASPWVWGKLVLWFVVGGLLAIPRRKPEWAKAVWWSMPVLGGVIAFLAVYKPGA